ncbi:sugar phosphate isomerase/epimerase family protein [Extibacter muris]|uniref:sugar phosphate isomerase/epimerase family protein n=1 Tax=Extibacter muris TaxID=1796622 RepID=UPI001D08D0C5|nr:TIM barrel protein [Extibacter muris]MCB6201221.1 sugar phosphate isomerase/epimerase [Extibacter muris]MCQ4664736.1 sugar phosphate isomerase/epimerase [Extibacter muris]MCQ4694562.1 sugar phosphate isomerase/epimerase [Extibacter muris]
MKNMKIGTVFEVAFPNCQRTPGYYLKCLQRMIDDSFYEALEVTHISDSELREETSKILKDSGMTIAYCAQPVILQNKLNLNDPERAGREQALLRMKECIDEACALGAESLSFLAGRFEEHAVDKSLEYLVESVRRMCSYAQNRLQIEIELFDYDIEKRSLIGPSERAVELARIIRKDYDNFWLLPDLSHIPQQHETIEKMLGNLLPYMRRTHIGNCVLEADSPLYGDCHPPFTYPGSCIGEMELSTYMGILTEAGFLNEFDRPMVSYEINPLSDAEIENVLADNKKMLMQAIDMLA